MNIHVQPIWWAEGCRPTAIWLCLKIGYPLVLTKSSHRSSIVPIKIAMLGYARFSDKPFRHGFIWWILGKPCIVSMVIFQFHMATSEVIPGMRKPFCMTWGHRGGGARPPTHQRPGNLQENLRFWLVKTADFLSQVHLGWWSPGRICAGNTFQHVCWLKSHSWVYPLVI